LIDNVAKSRTNIPPSQIPFNLIRTVIKELYGGKIDDDGHDLSLLGKLIDSFMVEECFDDDFEVLSRMDEIIKSFSQNNLKSNGNEEKEKLYLPQGTTRGVFEKWIDTLPDREKPRCLGLEADAERMLGLGRGRDVLNMVRRVVERVEESQGDF